MMAFKFRLIYGMETPAGTMGGEIRALTVEDLRTWLRSKSEAATVLFARIEDLDGVVQWKYEIEVND